MIAYGIDAGPWTLVIAEEHTPAMFSSLGSLSTTERSASTELRDAPLRALVELTSHTGGIRPRALVGGQLSAVSDEQTEFIVERTGTLRVGEQASCPSLIDATSQVPGLPVEFAEAALDALVRRQHSNPLPAGLLRIDRAAYDDVDSSSMVFELATSVLVHVIWSRFNGCLPNTHGLSAILNV